jgi:hypothetical protein
MKLSNSKLRAALTVGHLGVVLKVATVEKIFLVVSQFQG